MDGQVHVGARASHKSPICPYCHDAITADEASVWACPRCETRHHDGCASENGGCTLLGCGAPHRASGGSSHWPGTHERDAQLLASAAPLEPPRTTAVERPFGLVGAIIAAAGALLGGVGAFIELLGPTRQIAVSLAARPIGLGLILFVTGAVIWSLAKLLGAASPRR